MGVRKKPSSSNIGVRRSSYPSGPWIDAQGRPASSPNKSYYDATQTPTKRNATNSSLDLNPDPNNWKILQAKEVGKFLILMMEYPNCTNYEGKKILLFEDITLIDLVNQKQIDPHFFPANSNFKSPIARFEPTTRGWYMAEILAGRLLVSPDK